MLCRLLLPLLLTTQVAGFAVTLPNRSTSNFQLNILSAVKVESQVDSSIYDTPSQCYVIYPRADDDDDELSVDSAKELPRIVCTNEPEAYAWFNGIDHDDMIPTDGMTPLNSMQCEETESSRGIPEWECKLAP